MPLILIDGIDGLASGLSSISLLALGSLYIYYEQWVCHVCFSTLGCYFLSSIIMYSDRPTVAKKIFMGDTGSLTLGYILAFLAIAYTNNNSKRAPYTEGAIVVAFSTLIVPIFDVFRVILVRARNHKGLFNADRNHIHHKFLDMGFSPRKNDQHIGDGISFSVINMTLISYVNNNVLFIMDIVVWVGLNLWFDRIRNKHSYNSH